MPRRETNPWLVLVLVCIAQFMVILDATITNVALPSIQEDLEFSQTSLQWVINAYTVVFSVASLLDGLSQSGEMLIASRALQGLGAALISPAALSIITTTFAEGEE